MDIAENCRSAPAALDALGALGAIPPGLGIVDDGVIPYQDWVVVQQQTNFENRLSLDPEVKCYLPGVPRAIYMDQPLQIFQSSDFVMIAYQYASAVRTVHMNDPGPSPADSWMGWSIGRWEGDTLVVETTNFNDQTSFRGASENMRLTERFTRIADDVLSMARTAGGPMRTRYALLASVSTLVWVAAPTQAHHSFAAEFDAEKPIQLRGIVTEVRFIKRRVSRRCGRSGAAR